MKQLLALCLIPVLCLLQIAAPPEKKLILSVTVPQAQMILQALNECDCPQKTAADLRNYIVSEYNLQFPAPKVDSSKIKKP